MALIKEHDVALETPFPQLFDGLGVKDFIKPTTVLLPTQKENVEKYPDFCWSNKKNFDETITMIYPEGLKKGLSIPNAYDTFIIPKDYNFKLKVNPIWVETARQIINILDAKKPICLIKFPTERRHFNLPSRNPKMQYFKDFIDKNSYFYIDITKTDDNEWYSEAPPTGILKIDIDINTLIGMMTLSEMVLCSPGFMIPLSISLGVKTFCIFGGQIKPELLTDDRMDLTNFNYVTPEPFCNCLKAVHNCNKEIDERRIPRLIAA